MTKLYPILDSSALEKRNCSFGTAAEAFLGAGLSLIQFRHKGHWSREILAQADTVANLCAKHGAQMVVNDRADFAMLLNAGLHIGQDDLSPSDARGLIGAAAMLGFSTHNAAQLTAAATETVTYVALGPIFSTGNKEQPDPQVGLANLAAWRSLVQRPLVAIGGITRANALQVWNAGADSVAVIGDLLPDPCNDYTLRQRAEEWQGLIMLSFESADESAS